MLIEDGISWSTRFTNSLLINDKLWPNDYDVKVTFVPQTNDMTVQNLAYDKYKWIYAKAFQNSIFVLNSKKIYDNLSNFKNDIIDFVSQPYDQMSGVTMFKKLNMVGGDHLKVVCIEIESWQGENLRYTITEDSPENQILDDLEKEIEDQWWSNDLPVFSSFEKQQLTWEEIGFKIKEDSRLKVIKGGIK